MLSDADHKKILSLISLSVRAGLAAFGEVRCEKALKSGEAKLVVISCDASKNTKKKFNQKAFYYKVPVVFFGGKSELGKLTGAGNTSSVCVTDTNLSHKISNAIRSAITPGR